MISLTLRYSKYAGAMRIIHMAKNPTMSNMHSIPRIDIPD
jgi:hypothetical protein